MVRTDSDHVDAAWIEHTLHREGLIEAGSVASIDIDADAARTWSRIARIGVHYRDGATGRAPTRLLLKMCHGLGDAFGSSEVDYYRRDYCDAKDAPLPRCFDAAYADSPRRYHLLLEDLSATHSNADGVAPHGWYGRALAQSLAALHAHRWGEQRLLQLGQGLPTRDEIDRYVAHVSQGLEPMLALVEHRLPSAWPARLRALFDGLGAQLAQRAERAQEPHGMTLVHGDLNPGNILVPRDRSGPVLFIDRQPFDWSLTRWLAVSDLVYAIVPWWRTSARRRLEPMVLAHYCESLRSRGIDYPLSSVQADYRLCLRMAIAVAVQWCTVEADRDRMRWLWARQLKRSLAAYDDWH